MKHTLFFLPVGFLFAQDGGSPQSGMTGTLIMLVAAVVFFYFIIWRPEQKRRKAAEEMRGKMKKGDQVTAMGILGKIDRITDRTVVLKMIDGAKIEMLKAAITDVQPGSDDGHSS